MVPAAPFSRPTVSRRSPAVHCPRPEGPVEGLAVTVFVAGGGVTVTVLAAPGPLDVVPHAVASRPADAMLMAARPMAPSRLRNAHMANIPLLLLTTKDDGPGRGVTAEDLRRHIGDFGPVRGMSARPARRRA